MWEKEFTLTSFSYVRCMADLLLFFQFMMVEALPAEENTSKLGPPWKSFLNILGGKRKKVRKWRIYHSLAH